MRDSWDGKGIRTKLNSEKNYPKGRDNMGRHARIWENNIKIDLKEIR